MRGQLGKILPKHHSSVNFKYVQEAAFQTPCIAIMEKTDNLKYLIFLLFHQAGTLGIKQIIGSEIKTQFLLKLSHYF